MLAAIRSRLTNDPEEERVIAADELRRLARGRLLRAARCPAAAPAGAAPVPGPPPHGRARQSAHHAPPVAAPH